MSTHLRNPRTLSRLGVLLSLAALHSAAFATLGEDVGSVQADQVRIQAQSRIVAERSFSVHELRMASGTVVREFVSPSGMVFGVAWAGPFAPNLRQLLGVHFEEYTQGASLRESRRGSGLHIERGDMVFDSGGHMRFLVGRAYLRSRIPDGVTSDAVR